MMRLNRPTHGDPREFAIIMAAWRARSVLAVLTMAAQASAQLLMLQRNAFSTAECEDIVRAFEMMDQEQDNRQNPLLPGMTGSFDVSRANRYATATMNDAVRSIIARLLSSASLNQTFSEHTPPGATASASIFQEMIDFTLLHEFRADTHTKGFDWHVDSKPGDRTGRTLNVNVMLSAPGQDFDGGELQVGESVVAPSLGDAYVYPAALPHRVSPLERGVRHTLVIALTERHTNADSVDATGGVAIGSAAYSQRRRAYWQGIDAFFERVLKGSLRYEPKVHILHGEHLEAKGESAEAQAAYCKAYRATGTEQMADDGSTTSDAAARHAADFFHKGEAALGMTGGSPKGSSTVPNLDLAENYLRMAACVHPEHPEAAAALSVVLEAKRLRQGAPSSN
jgi:hypothetical protein